MTYPNNPPPRFREWRTKGVSFLFVFCVSRMLFSVFFTVGMFTVGIFTVGMFIVDMFTVGMFTVGFGIVCVTAPPHQTHTHPLLPRSNDVCPLLVSYFSITFLDVFM